jgi:hypothetical protein
MTLKLKKNVFRAVILVALKGEGGYFLADPLQRNTCKFLFRFRSVKKRQRDGTECGVRYEYYCSRK